MPEPTLGTLVSWKQDKAYGFIRPADGGKDVFVHLRDFGNIARAPKVGDRIRYQRLSDGAGRYRAADVQVEGMQRTATSRQSRPARRRPASPTVKSAELSATAGLVAGAGIACLLIALCVFTRLPLAVLLLYMVMSLVTFLIYAFDKAAAMNRRWRSRESTLLLAGLAGGWPGALVAQRMFRHKSRKVSFQAVYWFTVAANCAMLVWTCTESGAASVRELIY